MRHDLNLPRASLLLGLASSLVIATAWVIATPVTRAWADEPPAWYAQVQVDGMVSTRFDRNFNRPESRTNGYRVFDTSEGSFSLDVVELVAQKSVTAKGEAGFRFDLTAGSAIPRVAASSGLFRDDQGAAEDLDLQQGFVSWIAPVGSGLRLDFGKHVTHTGYEVIDGYDGWNDQTTRSLLFGYAIPFTHTGLRTGYVFNAHVAGMLHVVNGWDLARDNNRSKSIGAQLALTPSARANVLVSYMGGPEQADNNKNLRHLVDVVATLKPNDRITLGVNGDFATEAEAYEFKGEMRDAEWKGAALYARATLTPAWALAARLETFDDTDGFRTGTAQTLREVTVTPEWRPGANIVFRLDVRVDSSDEPVFEKKANVSDVKTQPTLTLNAIAFF